MLDSYCGLFAPLVGDCDKDRKQFAQSESMEQMSVDDERISPYLAYEDGYVWPDLWSEIDEMLESCVLISPLVEFRRKARAGDFDALAAEKILRMPLTHAQAIEVITANKAELAKDYAMTLAAVDKRSRSPISQSTIFALDDEFQQDELVYSIEVNHVRKRVTVCFRASVTKTDWATNYQIYMKEVQNPMRGHSSQEEMMRIHNGFFEYLLEPNALGGKGPNGELLSEYKKIMYRVLPFLQAHPGFKLYVTGHSMGAALATLLAFGAATEPDNVIPKPVSLFSIGGPYVGDLSFRSAHQLLEGLGKLRHLRLSNFKDIVPIIPKISFRFPFHREDHVGTFFKHVGMNLRLYAGSSPMEFSYPRVRTGFFSSKFDEISRGWEQSFFANFIWNPMDFWTWPYHNLKEYSERVDEYKPILQTVQLNDLYTRKDIVGNLLAEF